jgi:hypothetical protein
VSFQYKGFFEKENKSAVKMLRRYLPMDRAQKESSPITRVKCVVDNCEFWENGNHCLASAIEVQPPHAGDTQETDCATFQPKYGVAMDGYEAIKGVSGMAQGLNGNMGAADRVEM